MDAWRILLQRIVDKGIMRGEYSTVDADTVATILINHWRAVMLSKLYGDASHLERALNFLKTYVQHQLAAPV